MKTISQTRTTGSLHWFIVDQPNYTYKKGVGWVLDIYPRAERVMNGQKIILEKRPPKKGEHFWYWSESPQKLLNSLGSYHFEQDTELGGIAWEEHETCGRQTVVIVYHGPA